LVARTLVEADEAWAPPPTKFLPPAEFMIAIGRLLGVPLEDYLKSQADLGQRPWEVPSPEGWPQDDLVWAAPDALLQRLSWAGVIARRTAGTRDIEALAADAYGEALSAEARQAIKRAESRQQALALFLASSDFQTR
jgi:uncharacterized protein (DUF1800 family)